LYELKELLGHSSLTMVKRYVHLAPEHLRAAASALDDVFAHSRDAAEEIREMAHAAEVPSSTR
jgi:hypothetical protein